MLCEENVKERKKRPVAVTFATVLLLLAQFLCVIYLFWLPVFRRRRCVLLATASSFFILFFLLLASLSSPREFRFYLQRVAYKCQGRHLHLAFISPVLSI